MFARMNITRVLLLLALGLALLSGMGATAEAQTRRAFLVGINSYGGQKEREIQQLSLAVNDARLLARDLEELGFDKKNIKVVADLKSKEQFNKEFNEFLSTIQRDDIVFFFFSGHGFGIDATRQNYLLFGNLRSPLAFTISKLDPKERQSTDVARLRINSFMEAYQTEEIVKNGISVAEIQERIADRSPRTAIVIIDACRSIVPITRDAQITMRRGPTSGSRMISQPRPPQGFFVLYSASFGEQAVERFTDSNRRQQNSLFTEVLREEIMRPGQTLSELGERMRLVVDAVAKRASAQQTPEVSANLNRIQDVSLTGSIGGEVFRNDGTECEAAAADWREVRKGMRREEIERHIRRFRSCPTLAGAQQALASLAHGSIEERSRPVRVAQPGSLECDKLAAAPDDRTRPTGVPGVPFERLGVLNEPIGEDESSRREELVQVAVERCRADLAAQPNVGRLHFNLGRSLQRQASLLPADDPKRRPLIEQARRSYEEAARRGNAAALNTLAIILDEQGSEADQREATRLYARAAEQGNALAMANLAHRYKTGRPGLPRDFPAAYEWFARSAETGHVPAMIETADALRLQQGVARNGRRALDWYQRAAALGSVEARVKLGFLYYWGVVTTATSEEARLTDSSARLSSAERTRLEAVIASARANAVPADHTQALLWWARAAGDGDPLAQRLTADMTSLGRGLPNARPDVSQRYLRMAARAGDRDAQVVLGSRLADGNIVGVDEHGNQDAIRLLKDAVAQGSAEAAVRLARLERESGGGPERMREALRFAYRALQLVQQSNPAARDSQPFTEVQAGHLIAEMFRNGELDGLSPSPLTSEEVERIERFYGRVDRTPGADGRLRVKARSLQVPLNCTFNTNSVTVWVWDWGRNESPTEIQLRAEERKDSACATSANNDLRDTLTAVFEEAKKNRVPFADLIDQRIASARSLVDQPQQQRNRR